MIWLGAHPKNVLFDYALLPFWFALGSPSVSSSLLPLGLLGLTNTHPPSVSGLHTFRDFRRLSDDPIRLALPHPTTLGPGIYLVNYLCKCFFNVTGETRPVSQQEPVWGDLGGVNGCGRHLKGHRNPLEGVRRGRADAHV